jgi:choline dehydrogenase-like flavoprotein
VTEQVPPPALDPAATAAPLALAVDPIAGWSAGELATLASIAETFVRGGAVRRARLAAQAIAALDPAQARQLRLVLRLVESRLVNLALSGRPTAFRDLLPDARARYLLGWGTSRLALRRSGYQAFKKLLCFLAYADPGETGANPLWTTIGYRSPIEPLTDEPTPIVPLVPPLGDDAITLHADVVVVGSGAGGGVVAAEAARAGRSVIVVEAGQFIAEPEMPTDELAAYDRMYLDHGMTATWDGAVSILAASVVGGGTTVNWMTSIPAQPGVRAEWANDHGIDGADGAEFDDDQTVIEREIGVQGPPNVPAKDAAILRGAAALGWEAAETRRDGVGCGDCGSCPFGCRRGAKQGGLRVHLADAWRHGARILPDARVEKVLLAGGRVDGVAVRLADGRSLTIRAPQVVLAAGALRTPGILERSGVGHPSVGRFLRLHPVSVVGAFMRDAVTMWSGTTQAARSLEFLEPREPGGSGFVIESAPGHPGLIGLAFPWESTAGFQEIMTRVRRIAPLIAIVRDTGPGGRVRSTGSGGVRIDYPMGAVETATLRRGLVELARLGRAAGAGDMVALGTPPAWFRPGAASDAEARAFEAYLDRLRSFDFGPNRGMVFSAHQMGTARMGADPADHPVDERGRVRADVRGAVVPGLYVGDGSLFPTAIGVNPMITIMVLARRVARTVLAEAGAQPA